MKSVLRWCVVLLLASTLLAQTAAKPRAKKAAAKRAQPAVTLQDIQSLKDALAAQQQQIEQLKQEVQQKDQAWQQAQQQLQLAQSTASDAQVKAASAETVANSQKDTVVKLDSDMTDVKTTMTNTAVGTQEEQKRMSALEGLVGRFRFNGDVRVRGESFSQDAVADRNRARIRVRFGFDGKLNDDFIAGVSLASGGLGDPTSTNESLTNFFDRKTIALDRGYITYNPVAHRWVSVTGGKFAFTWNRTPMTFDSDLNPEGFSEKFSFDLNSPVLKNVTLVGMQLLFNEASGGTDSYALGGQISSKLQFGRWWTATPSFTALKWNNIDSLLNASAFAAGQSPGEGPGCKGGVQGFPVSTGGANCVFAPNNFTNATSSIGAGHFFSQFLYADFILNNQIKTPAARLPLNLLLEFIDNPQAKPHPLGSTGALRTDLGSQNKAYMADFSIGQQRNKNDIQVGYAWNRIEQDAVLAPFVESDQRTQTNVLQNRIYGLWRVRSNTTAAYTYWFGRTLNTSLQNATRSTGVAAGQQDARLNRMQFDLIYTF
ncbi:MAG TPA: putative porin [Terriglobales bacterium]|nr:putative porin [Terriglobales bacterium]